MRKLVCEIFDEIEKAKTRKDRLAILKFNDRYDLRCVLRGTYHPEIKYIIDSVPYYKPSDAPHGLSGNTIINEIKRVYLFEENNPKRSNNLSKEKIEKILIQILESLEAKEANVFMNMLLKKQKVKGLDYKLIKEAYPDLLP
jgi:hypothetical protein